MHEYTRNLLPQRELHPIDFLQKKKKKTKKNDYQIVLNKPLEDVPWWKKNARNLQEIYSAK